MPVSPFAILLKMAVEKIHNPEASPDLQSDKELLASDLATPRSLDHDVEPQLAANATGGFMEPKVSAFKNLGLLDRFLAV
jgi:hypothetical protein